MSERMARSLCTRTGQSPSLPRSDNREGRAPSRPKSGNREGRAPSRPKPESEYPEYELSGIENIVRGVCVVDGHVLLCRPKKGGYTYLPGGHIEFGETSRAALVREMKEETGLSVSVGDLLGVVESQFEQHGQPHCEISLVYQMTLGACPQLSGACPQPSGACPHTDAQGLSPAVGGLSPRFPAVEAQEDWIAFDWCPLDRLDAANLLPPEMKRLVSAMGPDPMARKVLTRC